MATDEVTESLKESCGGGFLLGGDFFTPSIRLGGVYIHFHPKQQRFLYNLTKTKGDVESSRKAAGLSEREVEKFFASAKWRAYREKVLAVASICNGDLRSEWWEFMLDGMKGRVEWYEGQCGLCHQSYRLKPAVAEQYRTDEMKLEMDCGVCRSGVALTRVEEVFKPSREQVQCASEIGARVEPKTERVAHSFTEEKFTFVTDDAAH